MQAVSSRARRRPAIAANWAIWELPRWLRRFVVATVLVYVAALVAAAAWLPLQLHDLEVFGVLLAFGLATVELTRRIGEPAGLTKDLRSKYKIKDSVKGVVVTSVDANSDAADKRLNAGDVIVEVAQEAVGSAADIKKRVDQLKKDGKKSVLLLVANGDGELRFVALSVQ